jgi:hypothetical protein
MTTDVFLSYSNSDRDTADEAVRHLESQGVSCWVAHRDAKAGEEWAASIVDAIALSRLVVLIYSSHSNKSQQVLREMERAVQSNIPILPLLIDDAPLSKSMRYFLGATHWLDAARKTPAERLTLLSETVKRVLKSEETVLLPSRLVLPASPRLRLLYWACVLISLPLLLIGTDAADGEFVVAIGSFALSFGLYGLLWGRSSWRTSLFVGALVGLALFVVITVIMPLL